MILVLCQEHLNRESALEQEVAVVDVFGQEQERKLEDGETGKKAAFALAMALGVG